MDPKDKKTVTGLEPTDDELEMLQDEDFIDMLITSAEAEYNGHFDDDDELSEDEQLLKEFGY